MSQGTVIRPATTADLTEVGALLRELDEHHRRLRPDLFGAFDGDAALEARVSGFLESGTGRLLVADEGGGLVGLVSVRIDEGPPGPMFRKLPRATVDNLFVNADRRGQGLGTALLEQAAAWVRSKGVGRMEISVWVANEASVSFFERQGFAPLVQRMERME